MKRIAPRLGPSTHQAVQPPHAGDSRGLLRRAGARRRAWRARSGSGARRPRRRPRACGASWGSGARPRRRALRCARPWSAVWSKRRSGPPCAVCAHRRGSVHAWTPPPAAHAQTDTWACRDGGRSQLPICGLHARPVGTLLAQHVASLGVLPTREDPHVSNFCLCPHRPHCGRRSRRLQSRPRGRGSRRHCAGMRCGCAAARRWRARPSVARLRATTLWGSLPRRPRARCMPGRKRRAGRAAEGRINSHGVLFADKVHCQGSGLTEALPTHGVPHLYCSLHRQGTVMHGAELAAGKGLTTATACRLPRSRSPPAAGRQSGSGVRPRMPRQRRQPRRKLWRQQRRPSGVGLRKPRQPCALARGGRSSASWKRARLSCGRCGVRGSVCEPGRLTYLKAYGLTLKGAPSGKEHRVHGRVRCISCSPL
jgi:hypothetical protein